MDCRLAGRGVIPSCRGGAEGAMAPKALRCRGVISKMRNAELNFLMSKVVNKIRSDLKMLTTRALIPNNPRSLGEGG